MLENSRGKTLTWKDIKLYKRKLGSQKTNPATLMIRSFQGEMEASPSCLSPFIRSSKSHMGSTNRTNSFLILPLLSILCLQCLSYHSRGCLNNIFPQMEDYNLYTVQMLSNAFIISTALIVLPMF